LYGQIHEEMDANWSSNGNPTDNLEGCKIETPSAGTLTKTEVKIKLIHFLESYKTTHTLPGFDLTSHIAPISLVAGGD
jgi:hypothetical protein